VGLVDPVPDLSLGAGVCGSGGCVYAAVWGFVGCGPVPCWPWHDLISDISWPEDRWGVSSLGVDEVLSVAMVALVVVVAGVSFRLARIDWSSGRLPNRLVGLLFLVAVLLGVGELVLEARAGCRLVGVSGACSASGTSSMFTAIGLVAVGLGLPLLLLNLVSPGSIGFGDVKLAVVMSCLLGVRGWSLAPVAVGVGTLLVGTSLGLAFGVLLRRGERSVPLGPGLIGGAWLMFAFLVVGVG